MKRIALFCVCYNSYNELNNFLCSIDIASKGCVVDVFVCDTTDDNVQSIKFLPDNFCLKIFQPKKNLGYFGGIHYLMQKIDTRIYNYFIISNVDLFVDKHAFEKLSKKEEMKNVGWIAPCIYSTFEKRDRNPKLLKRYDLKRLFLLKVLFSIPFLYSIYVKSLYKRKKMARDYNGHEKIYAGHGSFIILTKTYIEKCGIVNYPIFLFGEELYLAENCRNNDLVVVYEPQIKVSDIEHASTAKMKLKDYCFYNRKALSYIIKNFYKN